MEQGGRIIEKFVQEFKRAAQGSRYEERPLIKEFKRGINGGIRRKLMETERPSTTIRQWYKRAIALDRNGRESRREEERLRGKKESNRALAPKWNNQEIQRQILLQPQVWQRRQEMPPQQVTIEPALIEGVERMNVVVVRGQGMGFTRRDPYVMEVNRERNCYACGGFRYIA